MPGGDQPTVAIIGAGLGGVACAVNLARSGVDSFTVFEQADGPGGVWWHNDYPGCEVDVDSQAYSYSFMPYTWKRTHATQAEILRYVEDVIDHFGIRSNFRFKTTVSGVRWDEQVSGYWIDTDSGRVGPFDVVASSVGLLSRPQIPEWASAGAFGGPLFHSTSFDHSVDLAGKRVALIGTGSTACQLAPVLAERAGHLDVYQREPGYVLPKRAREFTPEEQEHYRRNPRAQKRERWRLLRQASKDSRAFKVASRHQDRVRSFHAQYLEKKVDDPVRQGVDEFHRALADAIDRMKTGPVNLPLLLVGGGAALVGQDLPGIPDVIRPDNADVANAVGAAIGQVSGEVDRTYNCDENGRGAAIEDARSRAIQAAINAGADPPTVTVIEMEDIPLQYLPGGARRIICRAIGDLAGLGVGTAPGRRTWMRPCSSIPR